MKNAKILGMLLVSSTIMFYSCEKESTGKENDDFSSSVNAFLQSLNDPIQKEVEGTKLDDEDIEVSGTEICTVSQYRASEEYSEVVLLDPTSDVIYVGSVLDGNSVVDGSYRPLILDRAPMTLSTDFENHDGSSVAYVENPSLSSVRDAVKEMLNDSEITGATKATTSFEIKEVHSEEEVNVAVGAKVSNSAFKVTSNFNFNKSSINSHFLVKFVQTYYTIDMDLPASPAKLFSPNVTVEDISVAMNWSSVVPVYVSSVKYGRIAYFAIESSENSTSMAAHLNAEFKALCVSGDASSSIDKNSSLNSSSISGTVIGGSSKDAVQAISGLEGMLNFIKNGGDYSKESPGAPVAFTLRRVSNNAVFNVVSGGTYVVRKCEERFNSFTFTPQYFVGMTTYNEVYGSFSVQLIQGDNVNQEYRIMNNNRDKFWAVGTSTGLPNSGQGEYPRGFVKVDGGYDYISQMDKTNDAILRFTLALKDKDNTGSDPVYYFLDKNGAPLETKVVDIKVSELDNNRFLQNGTKKGEYVINMTESLTQGGTYIKFVFSVAY